MTLFRLNCLADIAGDSVTVRLHCLLKKFSEYAVYAAGLYFAYAASRISSEANIFC